MIFRGCTVGGLELVNRVVVPPMCTWFADAETNEINDMHLVHYGALAMGGPGLIIFEGTSVERAGCIAPSDCGLWNDAQMNAFKRLTKLVHDYSCTKIGIQLAHAGRKALTKKVRSFGEPAPSGSQPLTEHMMPPCISSSNLPYDAGWRVPEPMSVQSCNAVKQMFVDAAVRAVEAGFDLIEIHNAHGYLLNQFTSPLVNKRTDQYGGSLENRCRYSVEIVEAIKQVLPEHIPLSVRISATDWVEAGGWKIDDSIYFAEKLRDAGADIIHVSSGGVIPEQKIEGSWGYQIKLSRQIKDAVENIMTIGVGGVSMIEDANDIVVNHDADLVAIGREHLRDPYWLRHQAAALGLPHWFPAYQILAYKQRIAS